MLEETKFTFTNHEFQVHKLTDEGLFKMNCIAFQFDCLLENLKEIWSYSDKSDATGKIINNLEGRLISIVRTKLEETCFFAKKAIAVSGKYDEIKKADYNPFAHQVTETIYQDQNCSKT
jgi:hypothetical protein